MTHKDPVTEAVYKEVVARDTLVRYWHLLTMYKVQHLTKEALVFWKEAQARPCIAPVVDPFDSGPCSGPLTLDHVHSHAGGTKGKRAPSDPQHLVALCYGHHLESRKGAIWATAHRPELRRYLEVINADHEGEGPGDHPGTWSS